MLDGHQELREIFRSRVGGSFARARICAAYARTAREAGAAEEVGKWVERIRVLRVAAARWRRRAQNIAPILVCFVWCLGGCGKAPTQGMPSREFTANFEVQPSPDGQSIVWSLQFKSREQYHTFLESTADGADRAKVRELIAAGMRLHHIVGCSAQEKTVTKLGNDGVAFVGSCAAGAYAKPAGGI
jgi:hypothetical protein